MERHQRADSHARIRLSLKKAGRPPERAPWTGASYVVQDCGAGAEADLVVTLAGCSVNDGRGLLLARTHFEPYFS